MKYDAHTDQSPLSYLCEAIDALEASAQPPSIPARFAFKAMIDVVDQSFQIASAMANGRDTSTGEVRRQFYLVTGKLLEVSRLLALPEDSSARKCLALIKWGE